MGRFKNLIKAETKKHERKSLIELRNSIINNNLSEKYKYELEKITNVLINYPELDYFVNDVEEKYKKRVTTSTGYGAFGETECSWDIYVNGFYYKYGYYVFFNKEDVPIYVLSIDLTKLLNDINKDIIKRNKIKLF